MMVDGQGRLKLADFGIAATVSDSVSRVSVRHSTSGTLPYMSPQQLAGKHPQVADDIYALGATLYELLTSKPPFTRGTSRTRYCTKRRSRRMSGWRRWGWRTPFRRTSPH